MDAYKEFTGKTVEEAIRTARDEFGVDLNDLDFEILTPGSRGVLGMGAEPARILAAPRGALGGAVPKREAASTQPLPAPPPPERRRDDRRDDRRGGRDRDRGRDGGRRGDRGRDGGRAAAASSPQPEAQAPRPDESRAPSRPAGSQLSSAETAEVAAAAEVAEDRGELEAAAASPEALEAGREILTELIALMGYDATVEVVGGDTSRLNVRGANEEEREALGALIGRKGERLSALQHIVNLMLARRLGEWTRVLVDVEDYRGRRERQLRDLAQRAAQRVEETGKMLQLEPMTPLERRWVHLALRGNPAVMTQSIGEEPNRRVVVLLRAD
jgi:spoIIIJ-associated protein